MRPLVFGSIAAMMGIGIGIPSWTNRPVPLEALMGRVHEERHEAADDRPELWMVFSPSNCKLTVEQGTRLNKLNDAGRVRVYAVMMDAPEDPSERQRVMSSFGLTVPLVVDANGSWRRSMQAFGSPTPSYIVRDHDRTVAAVAPGAIYPALSLLRDFAF